MTLGEAKNKIYMLLDEHSAGGEVEHDEDIEMKMCFFLDIAQKELAKIKKIVRTRKYTARSGTEEQMLPDDLMEIRAIWRGGRNAAGRYQIRGGKIVIPETETETVTLEYFAMPETIPADAADDYEFELAEDACNCMPYYVAAQQLLPDLVTDYGAFLQMYNLSVSTLVTELPGQYTARQTFFRGRN